MEPRPPTSPLLALARGRKTRRRVRLRYRDADDALTEREVDVLGLGFQDGRWYALAHCHLRLGLRLFRVDRVSSASATRRRACGYRLRDFDPAFFASVEFLEPGAAVAHLATVRLAGRLAGVASAIFPGAILERQGQERLCHLRASRLAPLAQLVASLGPEATLVSPPEEGNGSGSRQTHRS
jgi:predicted DNA-binding transcriptional regulator YafY